MAVCRSEFYLTYFTDGSVGAGSIGCLMAESGSEFYLTYFTDGSIGAGSSICLVSICRDHIISEGATAYGAGVGGITVFGTSRSGYSLVILVAGSRSLIGYIGVAAYRAGVGGVAACSAGRIGYSLVILVLDFALFLTYVTIGITIVVVLVAESRDLIFYVRVAAYAGVGGIAFCGAGRIGYNCFVLVTESCNFISNVRSLTSGASVGGETFCGASRIGYNCFIVVISYGSKFLCLDDQSAIGALNTIGQTGFGAGCSVAGNGLFSVRNGFYFVIDVIVAATAGVGGVTLFGAGRSGYNNRGVIIVTEGGSNLYATYATYGSFGTGCFVSLVTESGNFFLSLENFTANRAVGAFGQTGCGAGRSNCFLSYNGVSQLRNRFGYNGTATNGAFVVSLTVFFKGRFFINDPFADYVVLHRNHFLLLDHLLTSGTLNAVGKTGSCAGCILTGDDFLGVRNGFNFVCYVRVAAYASVSSVALLGASRSSNNCLVVVAESGSEFLLTYFAYRCIGAGCVVSLVTESVNVVINIGVAAGCAGVGGEACIFASRSGYNFCVIVTKSCNFVSNVRIAANGASVSGEACFGAGRSGYNGLVLVTESVNLICNIGVITVSAGVGGVSTFGTSGSGYNSLVIVAGCFGFVSYARVSAGCAGVGGVSVFCAGGSGNNCLVIVTESCNLIVYVRVAACGAGVGGVAFCGASGSGNNCFVVVAKSRNLISNVRIAANGAGVGGVAGFGAGGLSNNCFILVTESGSELYLTYFTNRSFGAGCFVSLVTKSCNLVSNVRIVACGAGVGGEACFGASGSGNNCFILVSESSLELYLTNFTNRSFGAGSLGCLVTKSSGFVGNVRIVANGAGVGGVATFGASGSGYNCIVLVTLCLNFVSNVGVIANRAGVGGVATFGAGGFCYNCIILVTKSCNLIINVGVVADSAGVNSVTVRNTGGSDYFGCVGVVCGCRNGLLLNENFAASRAMLAFRKTGFCAVGINTLINYNGVLMFGNLRSCCFLRCACGLLVNCWNFNEREIANDIFTRCQCKQNQCRQGRQNERFEKSFHFSPSRK